MSDLWRVFTEKLRVAGYTIDDLTGNDNLFQLVAEDICDFTPQQVSELQKEWRLQKVCKSEKFYSSSALNSINEENIISEEPLVLQSIFAAYPTSEVISRSGRFLNNLTEGETQILPLNVIEIPLSRRITQTFRKKLSSLHKPTGNVELMWKLCDPKTVKKIKEGQSLGYSDDILSSFGIIVYRDNGIMLQSLENSPIELISQGWSLVAFDTAVGKSRRLEKEEIQLLQNFSMEKCFNSLNNDGYDSIRIVSCNAFIIFDISQLIPRFIINIQINNIRQLNYSDLTNSIDSPGINFSRDVQDPKINNKNLYSTKIGLEKQLNSLNFSDSKEKNFLDCHKHPGKNVEFWCSKEKRLLCSHCLFYEGYNKDNCVLVTEAVQIEAEKLEQWVQNAITFTNEVEAVAQLFNSAEKDIDQCEQDRKEEVQEQFKRMHFKLNTLEVELITQIEGKSEQQRNSLSNCFSDIQLTVEKVRKLIEDAEEPLLKYRKGNIDYIVAVTFLRIAQSAFSDWRSVNIPVYSVIKGWDRNIFRELETALRPLTATEGNGQVELPEAIDINYLKN